MMAVVKYHQLIELIECHADSVFPLISEELNYLDLMTSFIL